MRDGSDDTYYDPMSRRRGRRTRARHARSTSGTGGGSRRASGQSSELQRAVDRFEQAVQDLVGSATSEFSDRAASFLNDATAKIERELGGASDDADYTGNDAAARMRARRRARARARSERILERSPRLCRDVENAKIVGVCAGIANYYGVEAWVVRCIAVTGLLFFGSIVFPAYWIMYFVMDDPRSTRRDKRRGRRSSEADRGATMVEERPRDLGPSRNLRNVQADLQEVELRLRRMETHVTSGQYELQRELNKIESDGQSGGTGEPPRARSVSE